MSRSPVHPAGWTDERTFCGGAEESPRKLLNDPQLQKKSSFGLGRPQGWAVRVSNGRAVPLSTTGSYDIDTEWTCPALRALQPRQRVPFTVASSEEQYEQAVEGVIHLPSSTRIDSVCDGECERAKSMGRSGARSRCLRREPADYRR
jgi:hypothetical protein